jgi:AraC-like DNA-binding protein
MISKAYRTHHNNQVARVQRIRDNAASLDSSYTDDRVQHTSSDAFANRGVVRATLGCQASAAPPAERRGPRESESEAHNTIFGQESYYTMEYGISKWGVPVYTYAGPRSGRDYEAWREEFCQHFCRPDAVPTAQERIECTVEVTPLGSVSFGSARGTSGSLVRTRDLLCDGCDDLVLITESIENVFAVQQGHTVELRPSQIGLLALDHVGESGLSDGGGYTGPRIPRRDLTDICRETEDKLFKPLMASSSMRDAVIDYFALCTAAAPSVDAVTQHAMARHMTELVELLLGSGSDEKSPALHNGYGAARLELIQAQILQHLSDDDLTIGSVARRTGLTPKQVQRLFGTTGVTFAEFVLEQRLLLACRMLSAGDGHRTKIATVAQDAGFGDLSYFNRKFRNRFGMTPTEWRDRPPEYA